MGRFKVCDEAVVGLKEPLFEGGGTRLAAGQVLEECADGKRPAGVEQGPDYNRTLGTCHPGL